MMCELAWCEELLLLNPLERRRQDAVVAYAEDQGGVVLAYLRRLFPRYWNLVPASDPEDDEELALTEEDETTILVGLGRAIYELDGPWSLKEHLPERPHIRYSGSVAHFGVAREYPQARRVAGAG